MKDPHVASLTYKMTGSERFKFDNPDAVEAETEQFKVRLENAELTLEMKNHFASVDEAKKAARDFLKSWEIDSYLQGSGIKFEYLRGSVIDRSGGPPLQTVEFGMAIGGHVTEHRRAYPEPPSGFETNEGVEKLWDRYNEFLQGREPLTSMANFCLTVVEGLAKDPTMPGTNREKAAKKYKISLPVLRKLGALSVKGRKYEGTSKTLSGAETAFIEATVQAFIKRLGQPPGSTPQLITLADLPKV